MAAEAFGLFEVALTECWPAATSSFCHQRYLETERLQDFDRRFADMRLMVTHESVVPENQPPPRCLQTVRRPTEPGIKSLSRITRERPLPGNPDSFCQKT